MHLTDIHTYHIVDLSHFHGNCDCCGLSQAAATHSWQSIPCAAKVQPIFSQAASGHSWQSIPSAAKVQPVFSRAAAGHRAASSTLVRLNVVAVVCATGCLQKTCCVVCLVAVVCVLAAAADLHIFSSLAIASQPTCKRTRFSLSPPILLYNVLCAVAVLCSFAVFAIFLCSVAMHSWLSSLRHVFARCVRAGRTCDTLKAIPKSSFPFAFCDTNAHATKNRSQP